MTTGIRLGYRLIAAAAVWLLTSAGAHAVSEDVFVVPRVAVQAQAQSATAAKDLAQRDGRRRAITLLLRRLTVEEDWAKLPAVGDISAPTAQEGAEPFAPAPSGPRLSDADLEELESGFEVYNEKSSSTTYRAFVTYRFKPDAVRRLLRNSGIAYSEAQTRTALVLPVLETANGVYLWEENNPWMAAWKVRPYNNELTPMIAPLGDLEDAGGVSAKAALNLNEEALAALAERYSVNQVIVAHGRLRQANGEDRLQVRLINGYRANPNAGGETALADELGPADTVEEGALDAAGYDGGVFGTAAPSPAVTQVETGDVLADASLSRSSGNFPLLAEEAIEKAIAVYAKPWKEQTLINHSVTSLLDVSAYYGSLNEWAQIRSALVDTPLVGSVQVRALSRGGAEMLIQAYGDPQKLVVAMDAQGLSLWSSDGEEWRIATPATAQGVRAADRRSQSDRGRDRWFGGDRRY